MHVPVECDRSEESASWMFRWTDALLLLQVNEVGNCGSFQQTGTFVSVYSASDLSEGGVTHKHRKSSKMLGAERNYSEKTFGGIKRSSTATPRQ